jgi:hypothetical protein
MDFEIGPVSSAPFKDMGDTYKITQRVPSFNLVQIVRCQLPLQSQTRQIALSPPPLPPLNTWGMVQQLHKDTS